jgi:hypothetical protein
VVCHSIHVYILLDFSTKDSSILLAYIPQSIIYLDGSRVLNLGDENVSGANSCQLVHGVGNVLAQHHCRNSNPATSFQAVDGRCSLARGDLGGLLEVAALDVVCAEDVFLSGCRSMLAFLNIDKAGGGGTY